MDGRLSSTQDAKLTDQERDAVVTLLDKAERDIGLAHHLWAHIASARRKLGLQTKKGKES